MPNAPLGHPACIVPDGAANEIVQALAVGVQLAVSDRHLAHLVQSEVMVVLEENRKHPRLGFVGSEQADNVFPRGSHVAMRARRPGIYWAAFGAKLAEIYMFRDTTISFSATPVLTVTPLVHSLNSYPSSGLASISTRVPSL